MISSTLYSRALPCSRRSSRASRPSLKSLASLQNLLRPAFEQHVDNAKMVTTLSPSFISASIPALDAAAALPQPPIPPSSDPAAPPPPPPPNYPVQVDGFVRWVSEMVSAGLNADLVQRKHQGTRPLSFSSL